MKDKIQLKAEKRKEVGRKVKRLRQEGVLPANLYGKGIKSESLQVDMVQFQKVFKETGETGLVELSIGNEKKPVLIHNLQRDPVSDMLLHADFLQVDLKQKVTASVPVEVVGESPAEKQGLGTAVLQLDEIEVEALPTDLPEKFVVDISVLEEVDQAIFVKDLQTEKGKVEIKDNMDEIVVKVEPVKEETEEVPPPAEETAEGEEEKETKGEGEEEKKEVKDEKDEGKEKEEPASA